MKGTRQVPFINEKIRATRMQLISYDGKNLGVVSKDEALALAAGAGLDLVIISDAGPDSVPVAKIIDFGKVEYEKKKKQTAAKKKQKVIKVKEIKLRPKISLHDLQIKMRQGVQFLEDGLRLKVTLIFKGRERAMARERGSQMFVQIEKEFEERGLKNVVHEKDFQAGEAWSRIYYLKDV